MGLYFLNSKEKLTKEQIGGKGYYLHQMAQDDLPIPPASFISTELWQEYQKDPKKTSEKIKKDVIPKIVQYFKDQNGGVMPLVSVRSAGAVSMPGMMDTVLNVGVNQKFISDFLSDAGSKNPPPAKKSSAKTAPKTKKAKKGEPDESLDDILNALKKDTEVLPEQFAADVYARFLTMYGDTVLGIPKEAFNKNKKFNSVADVIVHFEDLYQKHKKKLPSQKVEDQLFDCVLAVFDSWNNDRAKLYRKLNNINENAGTAVVIQQMIFGNKNNLSATGVMFSRNPSTGVNKLTGEYLTCAQGEDVVSGSHTPKDLDEMEDEFPESYKVLQEIAERLEKKYKQMQDIEFTIEDGKVYILQARTAKCAPFAKLKMLIDMYKVNEVTPQEVIDNLTLKDYLELNIKQVSPDAPPCDTQGLAGSMGAISGRVVFGPSSKYKDEPTIFLAKETTPDDLEAIQMATGILTASGGVTSHAAVVARAMGKVCVVGCKDIQVKLDKAGDHATLNGTVIRSGDWITLDGNSGKVWLKKDVPIIDAQNTQIFWDLEDLVIDAHPEWTRVTSKVDELVKGKPSFFLTYELDDAPFEHAKSELRDALTYLTGTIDLTGKLDFLQTKYKNQFLFADVSAQRIFQDKKELMLELALDHHDLITDDIQVYLGPYEKEHAKDFRAAGYKIRPASSVILDPSKAAQADQDALIITQQITQSLAKKPIGISSKNALLSVLK